MTLAVVGQVSARVSWHADDLKSHNGCSQFDPIAIAHRPAHLCDPLVAGSVDRTAIASDQWGDTRDVIAVMMGDQDGRQPHAASPEPGYNGRRIAGVDDRCGTAVMHDPDVVVPQGG